MTAATRLVGWYWTAKDCTRHYLKNVWEIRYDDQQQRHVHVNVGMMAMDDFGDLFLVGGAQ